MVDVAAITVAVISLVGSVLVAIASGFWAYYTDERKSRSETQKLLRKYRDPLLLAAQDLQARLYNITTLHLVDYWIESGQRQRDSLFIYTAFLFGQYLCWTHILKRQTQFLCFVADEKTNTASFIKLLDDITFVLNADRHNDPRGAPFMLWKGDQTAIGELMCVSENGELMCMGFSTFTQKWKEGGAAMRHASNSGYDKNHRDKATVTAADSVAAESDQQIAFRKWFEPIEEGIRAIGPRGQTRGDYRLRRLQHCLIDLVDALDTKSQRGDVKERGRVRPAPYCPCFACFEARKQKRVDGEGRAILREHQEMA